MLSLHKKERCEFPFPWPAPVSIATIDEGSLSAGNPGNASQTKKSGNSPVSGMDDEVAEFVKKSR
jgi:hypothetical protein